MALRPLAHTGKSTIIETMSVSSTLVWLVLLSALLGLALWLFDRTDIPHIKGLASVRGFPVLGSLMYLGTEHPHKLAELSESYGPVFQIRLGNKVSCLPRETLLLLTNL